VLSEMDIQSFISETKSNRPVPGGGSVASLLSALAAGLSMMVSNLTIGKKQYIAYEQEMIEIGNTIDPYIDEFIKLIDEDARSFNRVMKAYKLPKESESDLEFRAIEIQNELKNAVHVPLTVAEKTAELFPLIETLILKGNKNAESDILVAVMIARTAILSALFNVKINLNGISDLKFNGEITEKVEKLEKIAQNEEVRLLALSRLY